MYNQNQMSFILASGSPRRISLLKQVGYDFQVIVSHTDENFPDMLPAEEVPVYIARKKAAVVAEQQHDNHLPVLAADTVVILGQEIIGKPVSEEQAVAMLKKLSGKMHRVMTGVVLMHDQKVMTCTEETKVWFKELKTDEILYYVKHFQPYDKAGAYAIQEWIGLTGIIRIEGDYYNVMGLPVHKVMDMLQSLGIFPLYAERSASGSST